MMWVASMFNTTAFGAIPSISRCALGSHDWARAFREDDRRERADAIGRLVSVTITGYWSQRCRICGAWQ